jgi:hypothetical protein
VPFRRHVLLRGEGAAARGAAVETCVVGEDDAVEVREEGRDGRGEGSWVDVEAVGCGHVEEVLREGGAGVGAEQALRGVEVVVRVLVRRFGFNRGVVRLVRLRVDFCDGRCRRSRASGGCGGVHGGDSSSSGSVSSQWH